MVRERLPEEHQHHRGDAVLKAAGGRIEKSAEDRQSLGLVEHRSVPELSACRLQLGGASSCHGPTKEWDSVHPRGRGRGEPGVDVGLGANGPLPAARSEPSKERTSDSDRRLPTSPRPARRPDAPPTRRWWPQGQLRLDVAALGRLVGGGPRDAYPPGQLVRELLGDDRVGPVLPIVPLDPRQAAGPRSPTGDPGQGRQGAATSTTWTSDWPAFAAPA